MRSTSLFLLAVLLLLPIGASAQKACYSPSDCTGMMHCTSLDDSIVPGRCTTDARITNTKPKVTPPPAPKAPPPTPAPSLGITPEQQEAMLKSLASTMKSMMDSMNSMMTGMLKSLSCILGCKKA
jgi:hypothetical protein